MPWEWAMHWWPRHTPRIGILEAKCFMMSFETPPCFGVHGPGEMMMWLGLSFWAWVGVILSFR